MIESHHDHLIDVKSGEIIEFVDEEIENLQKSCWKIWVYFGWPQTRALRS